MVILSKHSMNVISKLGLNRSLECLSIDNTNSLAKKIEVLNLSLGKLKV